MAAFAEVDAKEITTLFSMHVVVNIKAFRAQADRRCPSGVTRDFAVKAQVRKVVNINQVV